MTIFHGMSPPRTQDPSTGSKMPARYLPLQSTTSQNFKAARGKEGTELVFVSKYFFQMHKSILIYFKLNLAQVGKMMKHQVYKMSMIR